MIVKELESGHRNSQDVLFGYWLLGQLIHQSEEKGSLLSEAERQVWSLYPSDVFQSIRNMVTAESQLLLRRGGLERFFGTNEEKLSTFIPKPNTFTEGLSVLRSFPAFMAEWNASSRRVFQLGKEMQHLLEITDYRELKMSDLVVPFPNFLVRLAEPLRFLGKQFHSIGFSDEMLSKETTTPETLSWGYVFLGKDYEPVSEMRKQRIVKKLSKPKNFTEVYLEMQEIMKHANRSMTMSLPIILDEDLKLKDSEYVDFQNPEDIRDFYRAHSIVVNLIAILPLLSKRMGQSSNWLKSKPSKDICSTNNVFEIGGVNSLDESNGVSISGIKNESSDSRHHVITPYWRVAHKRRRPGMGHIPDAPKEVKVKRTLVLGDFLSEGEFPLGSVTKL